MYSLFSFLKSEKLSWDCLKIMGASLLLIWKWDHKAEFVTWSKDCDINYLILWYHKISLLYDISKKKKILWSQNFTPHYNLLIHHFVASQIDLLSPVMTKPVYVLFMSYTNNKNADRLAHPHSLIKVFVIRYLYSMIPIYAIPNISRFILLVSVAEQAGLSLTWSASFLVTWFIWYLQSYLIYNKIATIF